MVKGHPTGARHPRLAIDHASAGSYATGGSAGGGAATRRESCGAPCGGARAARAPTLAALRTRRSCRVSARSRSKRRGCAAADFGPLRATGRRRESCLLYTSDAADE